MPTAVAPRFGVEIEFLGAPRDVVTRALTDAGIPAAEEDYNHRTRDYWKVITDSSCGYEMVSPPLYWHQRLVIRQAMRVARQVGADVNVDCGLHVHHEWPWDTVLTPAVRDERLTAIRRLYRATEPLLRVLLPPSRWEENRFCRFSPIGAPARPLCPHCNLVDCGWCADCDAHSEDWDNDGDYCCPHFERDSGGVSYCEQNLPRRDPDSGSEDLYGDRYQAVNFQSLGKYHTVEFRQHQGTLNPTKALAWVEFTRNVTHAASRHEVAPSEAYGFVFDKLSTSTNRHFRQRCADAGFDFDDLVAAGAAKADEVFAD